MTASEYIKSHGFTGGITRIAKITGWDRRTLYRYYHEEPLRFEIIVLGCVVRQFDNDRLHEMTKRFNDGLSAAVQNCAEGLFKEKE